MQIEVVDFYIMKRNDKKQWFLGTMHVYLPEKDLDIRGVLVKKKKDKWFFLLPSKSAIDAETNKKVFYPTINFCNPKTNQDLQLSIKRVGRSYIERAMREAA